MKEATPAGVRRSPISRSLSLTIAVLALLAALVQAPVTCLGENLPSPASFRKEFEAQFPKAKASAAALELERLAALLGIELAPKLEPRPPAEAPREGEETEDQAQGANGEEATADVETTPAPVLEVQENRARPSAKAAAALQAVQAALGSFLDRELKSPQEQVGATPRAVERFLTDHEGELEAIESLLLREGSLQWGMDVTPKADTHLPNVLGHLRLQRLLVARALLEMRRGETDAANQTLEASWQLNEALSSRPELIPHLIVVAVAKYQAGALRKLVAPAAGWADRLRSQKLLLGYLAAFQNEFWFVWEADDLTGEEGAWGRTLRGMAEELQARDPCSWTPKMLEQAWERAFDAQYATDDLDRGWLGTIALNLTSIIARWGRYLVDAELTSLVLDARTERAASREKAWPGKLFTLGAGICPRSWTYRPSPKGTATLAFQGSLAEDAAPPARHLPLTFTAGVPAPTPRKTRTPRARKQVGKP